MELADLSALVLLWLFFAALIAGFLDTLVGGGGLITIPALLMSGVPPIFALGTNKLQAVVGSGTASLMMIKHRKVDFNQVRILMLMAFVGALLGTVVVQFFDPKLLALVIPFVIVVICCYFLLAPAQSLKTRVPRISKLVYTRFVVPAIGFYDGMFGPGTGSFLVLAGVALRGQELLSATATAKVLNFATNIASLVVFVFFGKVLWVVGGVMMVGQGIGAHLGAKILFVINPLLLRWLIIVMCLVMLISWAMSSLVAG